MDDLQQLAAAYATHRGMEHTRSYIQRGRSLATMAVAGVETCWVNAFRATCYDGDNSKMRQMRDAAAELGLRKIEQPYSQVQGLIPAIIDRISDMHDELAADMTSFMEELQKPPN